jgi:hypothetical protein
VNKKIERYGPCYVCGGKDVYAYSRWEWESGDQPKLKSSYIQCDDCHTTSKNTTSNFTWEQVIKDWKKNGKFINV